MAEFFTHVFNGIGSGVIYDASGLVLTAHHVVESDRKSTRLNSSH